MSASQAMEMREGKWERELEELLSKSRKWKALQYILNRSKRRTTATNPWLARKLEMGHPSRVCNLVNEI